jgi:hypothetical protein
MLSPRAEGFVDTGDGHIVRNETSPSIEATAPIS